MWVAVIHPHLFLILLTPAQHIPWHLTMIETEDRNQQANPQSTDSVGLREEYRLSSQPLMKIFCRCLPQSLATGSPCSGSLSTSLPTKPHSWLPVGFLAAPLISLRPVSKKSGGKGGRKGDQEGGWEGAGRVAGRGARRVAGKVAGRGARREAEGWPGGWLSS